MPPCHGHERCMHELILGYHHRWNKLYCTPPTPVKTIHRRTVTPSWVPALSNDPGHKLLRHNPVHSESGVFISLISSASLSAYPRDYQRLCGPIPPQECERHLLTMLAHIAGLATTTGPVFLQHGCGTLVPVCWYLVALSHLLEPRQDRGGSPPPS